MNIKEIKEKLKNGGFEVEEITKNEDFAYQKAKIKIRKCLVEDPQNTVYTHPLLNILKSPVIVFEMEIMFSDGGVQEHVEVTPFFTKKGKFNYYSGFENVPSSFLYEITQKIYEYEKKDKPKKFIFLPEFFENKIFEINVKKLKNGNCILKTERQKLKDKKYEFEKIQKYMLSSNEDDLSF